MYPPICAQALHSNRIVLNTLIHVLDTDITVCPS